MRQEQIHEDGPGLCFRILGFDCQEKMFSISLIENEFNPTVVHLCRATSCSLLYSVNFVKTTYISCKNKTNSVDLAQFWSSFSPVLDPF